MIDGDYHPLCACDSGFGLMVTSICPRCRLPGRGNVMRCEMGEDIDQLNRHTAHVEAVNAAGTRDNPPEQSDAQRLDAMIAQNVAFRLALLDLYNQNKGWLQHVKYAPGWMLIEAWVDKVLDSVENNQ